MSLRVSVACPTQLADGEAMGLLPENYRFKIQKFEQKTRLLH
jgi:hypothetical protein